MSYYPQYFAVITHNIEEHFAFTFHIALQRIAYYSYGIIYPSLGINEIQD